MHRGKVDPGVSELPRGNELSRDHVNRPIHYGSIDRTKKRNCSLYLAHHCCLTDRLAEMLALSSSISLFRSSFLYRNRPFVLKGIIAIWSHNVLVNLLIIKTDMQWPVLVN